MTLLVSILYWLLAVAWLGVTAVALRAVLQLRNLPPMTEPTGREGNCPSVSVVIPARNEAERIETTVRMLLAQRGVDQEVIVVDDRSSDRTGEILDRLREEDRRLTVIHNDHLPNDWIGQCYALHVGAERAGGEWILFTDADIWMKPDVLTRSISAAAAEKVDHICLMPYQREATLLGKAAMILMMVGVSESFRKVARRRGTHVGFGAFNLVRAAVYRSFGGHVPLRLEINNDSRLGLLISRTGKRTRGFFPGRDVEMDLARTPAEFIRVMEKNAFSYLRFSPLAIPLVLVATALWLAAMAGPFVYGLAGLSAAAMLLGYSVPAMLLARRFQWPLLAGLLTPVIFPIVMLTGINSVVVTLKRGGVRWHDQFYSLKTLREGMVR